jgi:lysophospholipase L1-like esterase
MRRWCLLPLLLAMTACVLEPSSGANQLLPGDPNGRRPAAPTPSRKPVGGPIFAVGDSILLGAVEHGGLGVQLADDGWDLETVAETGRTTRWAVDQIRVRESVARYVIVVLGSNPGHSSSGFRDDVESLRDALVARGARRILWIPPYHADPERYSEKDAILAQIDQADRLILVPDWAAVIGQHPEWTVGDGLHLTEEGYQALASFVRDQVARLR